MTSRTRLVAGIAIGLLAAVALLSGCTNDSGVIAKVNGRPIEKKAVDDQIAQMKKASPQSFQASDTAAVELDYRAKILENLIQIELIKEAADKQGISITSKQIDDYIAQLEAQYGGKSGLQDAMKQSGMTDQQLRDAVQSRLLVDAVREKVTKAGDVTEAQAREYYDKNIALFKTQAQVHAEHILIADKDKALADKLFAQVKGGADFATLAKANSTDPGSKDAGGDLGWKSPSGYVTEFAQAVSQMKVGEVRLVHTQFGWHIIKLLETKPESQKTFDEVKEQITTMLGEQARSDQFTAYLADARKKAKIEIFDEQLKKTVDANAAASQPTTATQ